MATAASKPYPNDSAEYRAARTRLLAEEIELRRHLERVAAMRRELPLGGRPRDYQFLNENGKTVRLGELFGKHDTLVTYFWMFGPQRERPCPMCTSFLGSIDVPARDITQKMALAVLGRSPVARQLAFARERGWRNLKFFQTVGDDFARDYRGLDERKIRSSRAGPQWVMLHFQLEPQNDFLLVRLTGLVSPEAWQEVLEKLEEAIKDALSDRLVGDLTGLVGLLGEPERRAVGALMATRLARMKKVALVIDAQKITGVVEEEAQRGGLDLRLFSSYEDAVQWATS